MDGYDKLKPYGICIHGCVDGFSRCVLWMDAWTTNNDPKVVAGYYLDTVERLHGCPERIRSDAGGENRHVEQMQLLLRHDHNDRFAGSKSFLYGSSVHNQRIEFWWGILRKQCVQYWMDMFKHLKNEDLFCGDYLDKSLVQFCFLDVIQKEIKDVAQTWNFHQIRANKNNPSGKPSVLFSLPQLYGAEDHLKHVCPASLELCRQECTPRGTSSTCPQVWPTGLLDNLDRVLNLTNIGLFSPLPVVRSKSEPVQKRRNFDKSSEFSSRMYFVKKPDVAL
ncbi:uncharacterized protein LOC124277257 [Haliotis rubra]|uniref:uncharacterized protein LOC124277257 n=1 Tax=Haliotis rubra TaxID=36100 RepID=UPI001EE54B1C|nr:uncharacterized protein LOC124277257 [Haliotis rubra]